MNEQERYKQELEELLNEKRQIEEQILHCDNVLKPRLTELMDVWNSQGLITQVRLKLRDCQFPVYEKNKRIIDVNDKYINIREDGNHGIEEYSVETGIIKRGRDNSWTKRIDAKKAMEIWEEHKKTIDSALKT
jgi:hypothetical protein